tara:strand:- start:256 stop:498 length:243 start_codon:yes stop_codon:yes gene_type:complete
MGNSLSDHDDTSFWDSESDVPDDSIRIKDGFNHIQFEPDYENRSLDFSVWTFMGGMEISYQEARRLHGFLENFLNNFPQK